MSEATVGRITFGPANPKPEPNLKSSTIFDTPPPGVRFVQVENRGARTWAQIKADEKRFRSALEKITQTKDEDEMRRLAREALQRG